MTDRPSPDQPEDQQPDSGRVFTERFARSEGRFNRWLAGEANELKPGGRHKILRDMLAGIPGAIASVPDGMAAGVLAGVNPAHGLYASIGGPVAGGLTSSTRMMIVATTGAAALAAGSAIAGYPAEDRSGAMILLTVLTGMILVAIAAIGLTRYIRYVSYSVTLGFLTGVSLNMVFSQVPDLVGVAAPGSLSITKFWYAIVHPSEIVWASAAMGLAALAILIIFDRTKLGAIGSLIALVVPTLLVHFLDLEQVARVKDIGAIPHGLPIPQLPDFSLLTPGLVAGAAAVAALVIIQGAGVAEAAPNSDGRPSSNRRDVVSQGLGNAASGALGGMPVGGSVGQTALNVAAGAQTRWASIWGGIWMAAILLAFSGLVGEVAMPTLAAVLIYAGAVSIRPREVIAVARAGRIPAIAIFATFIAVMVLPVAEAVGVGVLASLILQLNQEALDLRLVRLERGPQGEMIEGEVPDSVSGADVVVLNAYGSMFFAGAKTLQRRLPAPMAAEDGAGGGPVVILRLRGRTTLGATFATVISRYARRLEAVGGELYLSGVDPVLAKRWTVDVDEDSTLISGIRIFEATPVIGESTLRAISEAGTSTHRVRPTGPDDEATQ